MWGNPYLRVLRSQLELYIVAQLGSEYLVSKKSAAELRAISKEIADLRKKLTALEQVPIPVGVVMSFLEPLSSQAGSTR